MKLEELEVYQMAMDLAEKIWVLVGNWEYFAKDTIGHKSSKKTDH